MQALRGRAGRVLLVLLCLAGVAVAAAAPAVAASGALPGLCDPEAPVPDEPGTGMPGFFMDDDSLTPQRGNGEIADLASLYNDSGFSGLSSSTYDLGCSANPDNWGKMLSAAPDTAFGNRAVSVGQAATALADAADTRAWDPSWIFAALGDFTRRVMDIVTLRVLAPYLACGLLASSIFLVYLARKGNVAPVAAGVAWALFVVIVVTLLTAAPLRVATAAQAAGGSMVSALNGDRSGKPGRSTTEQIMFSVHYQGWARRTFGSPNSAAATEYGPRLLAASRMTRAEYAATDPARKVNGKALSVAEQEASLRARKYILDRKAKQYTKIASEIKDRYPSAYRYLQGAGGTTTGVGLLEMCFALVASAGRLAVDLLLLLAVVILVALGVAWVIAAPFIVTPHGEKLGRGLLDNTGRAIVFVALAAFGSWLLGLWIQVSLSPGIAAWWSMLLLIVGTVVFWSLLRPDRKALNLITMGRMDGHSRTLRRMAMLAGGTYLATKARSAAKATKARAATERAALHSEMSPDPADSERAREYRLGRPVAPDPYAASAPDDGPDPYETTGAARSVSAPPRPPSPPAPSMDVFRAGSADRRPAPPSLPSPPPLGSIGEEDVYRAESRPDRRSAIRPPTEGRTAR